MQEPQTTTLDDGVQIREISTKEHLLFLDILSTADKDTMLGTVDWKAFIILISCYTKNGVPFLLNYGSIKGDGDKPRSLLLQQTTFAELNSAKEDLLSRTRKTWFDNAWEKARDLTDPIFIEELDDIKKKATPEEKSGS
jgi:hypothetical protein